MPTGWKDNSRGTWSERLYRANLAKIERVRASNDLRLKNSIDGMEVALKDEVGEDGYRDILGKSPIEAILRQFQARQGRGAGKKPPRSSRPSAVATGSVPSPARQHGEATTPDSDDDEGEYYFRNSTDAEQALIDERRSASVARRAEIDEELDAIHEDRLFRIENDLPVDEFSAEEALDRHRRRRAERNRQSDVASRSGDARFDPNAMSRQSAGTVRPGIGTGSPEEPAMASSPVLGATDRGNWVSVSGVPTSEPEAPSLEVPEVVPSDVPDDSRGSLDDGEDDRGVLDDAKEIDDAAKREAETGNREKKRRILRLLIPALMHLMPIIIVIAAILMLAQCVASLNPFGGSGSQGGTTGDASAASVGTAATTSATSDGLVTRQSANPGIPNVYVDPALADLFSDDGDEDPNEDAVTDYPYVATFFGSDNDWTDTLYASDDCVNFKAIGTVPNSQRDPCIMLRNGRYWVVTCLNDEDGHVWLMVSSSRDLKEWVGPTKNGPFNLDRLPRCNGYGTSSNYDVVAPEWFLDEDNSVHVILSCGHWGACHGHNWDDWMESYMLDVDELKMSGKENVLTSKGPLRWMDVNANYADRIDGTIDFVNGTYYLTIKRNGLNMELWKNSSCSPYGWVRLRDCFLYGYEAPCLFQDHEGTWHILGDGCPDVRPFGTKMWTSNSIDGNWTQQTIHFFRDDGSEVPVVRHGTVLPVEGAKGGGGATGGRQSDGTLNSKQKSVISACKSTGSPGAGYCALWVGNVYANANVGVSFRGHAYQWYYECCKAGSPHNGGTVKTDPNRSTLKPGMVIAVPSSSSGTSAGRTFGHVGIYIGGGKVMHNIGSIDTCTVDEWINAYGKYAPVGWGYPTGMK